MRYSILLLAVILLSGCSTTRVDYKEMVFKPNKSGIIRIVIGTRDQESIKKESQFLMDRFCKPLRPEIIKITWGEQTTNYSQVDIGYGYISTSSAVASTQEIHFECTNSLDNTKTNKSN